MTRKHFEALAAALRATNASEATCLAIVRVCAEANGLFSCDSFMTACGY